MDKTDPKIGILYEALVGVAKAHGITYYGDLGPLVNMAPISLGEPLGIISTMEVEAGRPMLSAVVASVDTDVPSVGFFELATSLGRFHGKNGDAFLEEELRKVHECWAE